MHGSVTARKGEEEACLRGHVVHSSQFFLLNPCTQHSSAYLQLDLPISTMHDDGQHSFVTTATRSSCAINKYQAAGYAECY